MARVNNLRKIRLELGLTITQLAGLSGVSTATIGRVERENKIVSDLTKNRIVNGLNKVATKKEIILEQIFP